MPRTDNIPCQRILQLTDRIGGAAWPHKDQVCIEKWFDDLRVIRAESRTTFARRDQVNDRFEVLQTCFEEIAYAPCNKGRIKLKASRCFHNGHPQRIRNEACQRFENPPACEGG